MAVTFLLLQLLFIIAVPVEPSNGHDKSRQGGGKSQESKVPSQGIFQSLSILY